MSRCGFGGEIAFDTGAQRDRDIVEELFVGLHIQARRRQRGMQPCHHVDPPSCAGPGGDVDAGVGCELPRTSRRGEGVWMRPPRHANAQQTLKVYVYLYFARTFLTQSSCVMWMVGRERSTLMES